AYPSLQHKQQTTTPCPYTTLFRSNKIKVVLNGAGAAGVAIVKLLNSFGVKDLIMCDSRGAIYEGRPNGMNAVKEEISKYTNLKNEEGTLEEVIEGADVFIGVSVADALTPDMVRTMADDS